MENSCSDIYLDDNVLNGFTKWLTENQNKTVVILDGLDRTSNLQLPKVFKTNLDKIHTSKHWISAILARKVLSNCKVILTSRPYALCSLHGDFTGNCNFKLDGFTNKNVEMAIDLYVEKEEDKEKAKRCYKLIIEKRLLKLATNPNSIFLLFQIVDTGIDIESEDITTTSLYNKVFTNVFNTKSYAHEETNDESMIKLEKICFELICQRKFTIEKGDLGNALTFEALEKLIPIEARNINKAYYSIHRKKLVQISHQLGQVKQLF